MTGPTTKSRRSDGLLTVLLSLLVLTGSAAAAPQPKLPVIGQVGVVPPQWESDQGGDASLDRARELLEPSFSRAVRESRRFRVLSDDLVADLWQDADGREELRTEFELNSFVSLAVEPRSDAVTLTVRLLDGFLKSQLLESDTVPRAWLAHADRAAVDDRLQKLVFRLFNRIPVDVSVTSVQGQYVTLSGGAEQGVQAGDKVDLVRTTIKSLHPATGAWLDFDRKPLGTATVIEAKSYTSVARLTSQVRERAVEVGDGAKIAAIAARARFQRLASNDENGEHAFKDAGPQGTIIVPPLYTDGRTPKAPAAPKPFAGKSDGATAQAPADAPSGDALGPTALPQDGGATHEGGDKKLADNATKQGDGQSEGEGNEDGEAPPVDPAVAGGSPEQSGDPNVWDRAVDDLSKKFIDDITVELGPQRWFAKSKVFRQNGKFPLWLINSIGGGVTRSTVLNFHVGFGGGLAFGKTSVGNYTGFDTYARIYWQDELSLADGLLKTWHAGGEATFAGMAVPKGYYGGGDWLRGGLFGGFGGMINGGEGGDRYDWTGEFQVVPLHIGRHGYRKAFKRIESGIGTRWSLNVFKHELPQIVQIGGGIEYAEDKTTLTNALRVQTSSIAFKAMAKYAF